MLICKSTIVWLLYIILYIIEHWMNCLNYDIDALKQWIFTCAVMIHDVQSFLSRSWSMSLQSYFSRPKKLQSYFQRHWCGGQSSCQAAIGAAMIVALSHPPDYLLEPLDQKWSGLPFHLKLSYYVKKKKKDRWFKTIRKVHALMLLHETTASR